MLNNVSLMGRLTKEPELRQTSGKGTYYCRFTLACQRDLSKDTTDFIDCVAWTKTAQLITSHFHKGERMTVVGLITTRTNENVKYTEILVQNVGFVEPKEKQAAPAQTEVVPVPPPPFDVPVTEEEQKALPFDVLGF